MMRRLMVLLGLLALLAAGFAAPALAEKRVALVIGNADYASLSDLRNPANDARDMAAALQGLGFSLVGGKPQVNLSRRDMLRTIREFAGALAPGDVALFYYAGHGAQHGGENYLIPVDDGDIAYREDLPDSAVGADAVRRQLETAGAVTALLFLDACRNTPLPMRAGGRTASRGLARMQEIPGSYVAFAAAPGQEAADGAGRNGLFTAALLKALGKPERRIEDIFMETAAEVARQSSRQQQPWSSSSLERPFYFKGDGGRGGSPVDHAALAFQALTSSNDPEEFETFARTFPNSPLAATAMQRARSLRGQQAALTAPPKPEPSRSNVIPVVGVFPQVKSVFKDCSDCPEMVVVPAGSFMMGSPESESERSSDEGPQRTVRIPRDFAVGRYEVTQAEWRAVIGNSPSAFKGDRLPVESVSWNDAQEFIKRLSAKTKQSYRLLTEAEWEYAARAGTTTPFHTGRNITTDQANFNGNYTYNGGAKGVYREKTMAAGSFAANGFGLHDMHGNVWEWVEDCYGDDANAANDGSGVSGNNSCKFRVLRGGSWIGDPQNLRSASRGNNTADYRNYNIGFRVARTLTP